MNFFLKRTIVSAPPRRTDPARNARVSRARAAAVICLAVVILATSFPFTARAETSWADKIGAKVKSLTSFGLANLATTVIAKAVLFPVWLFGLIFGFFVLLETWFIGLILFISTKVGTNPGIIGSAAVKTGYAVVLNLANIFFVLGIVVIAIMTILRSQTYGIKKALWKLIAMAVLVNFGLMIAGVIIGFADNLTLYWLQSTMSGPGIGDPLFNPFHNFSSGMAASLEPQARLVKDFDIDNAAALLGAASAATLAPFADVILTTFMLLVMMIVLGVFLVMLLVRYVYLSILLILLPLAWASFIFPATESHWRKWWDKFIQQTFFAPLVIFFIWLAIETSEGIRASGVSLIMPAMGDGNDAWAAIKTFLGNFLGNLGIHLLQVTVVIGMMVGGMMAAQAMGVKLAGAAINAVEGAARGFRGYVVRRATGGFARRATVPPPERQTAFGRTMQRLNPMHYIRKAAQGEVAQRRGWTEAMKQHGEKTDFGRPKQLWAKAKDHDAVLKEVGGVKAGRGNAERRIAELKAITPKNAQEKQAIDDQIQKQEEALRRLDTIGGTLMQKARSQLGIEANTLTDLADKTEKASKKLKEQTWEAYSSNRGPIGSAWFGALKGTGMWKAKPKLKLSEEQKETLQALVGIEVPETEAAPTVAPPSAGGGGTTP